MRTSLTKRICAVILLLSGTGAAVAEIKQLPRAPWFTPAQAQSVTAIRPALPAHPTAASASHYHSLRLIKPIVPPPVSPQFRQQEQYLNLLLRGEQSLIRAQEQSLVQFYRVQSALGGVNALLRFTPVGRNTANLVRFAQALTQRLDALKFTLAVNTAYMRLGLRSETAVLSMMTKEAPFAPELRFYRFAVLEQGRLVNYISRGFGSPTRPGMP